MSKYNVNFFIKKFMAIPAKKWTMKELKNDKGQCCALGHCGGYRTAQARALQVILEKKVISINDNAPRFQRLGAGPKTRIIKALRLVKQKKSIY